jgi:hypothetical protein
MIMVIVGAAIIQLGLGLLFIAAGISKLLRTRSVHHTVERYRLLPSGGVKVVAWLLGPIELATGTLLVLSPWIPVHPLAWTTATGLLLLFSIAIGSALARGISIPCGCGLLLGDHVITPITLSRNLLLLTLLIVDCMLVGW